MDSILPRTQVKEEQLVMEMKIMMMYLREIDCLESTWIEIKNKNNKNISCGCLYRHPKYDLSEFINYLETTLKKIASENKEVYICGVF